MCLYLAYALLDVCLVCLFVSIWQVLVDCPTRRIIDRHYTVLDPSHLIKQPRKSGHYWHSSCGNLVYCVVWCTCMCACWIKL